MQDFRISLFVFFIQENKIEFKKTILDIIIIGFII